MDSKRFVMNNWNELSDLELIKEIQAGQQAMFEVLIDRYQPKLEMLLYQLCYDKSEVNSYIHDAFVKAYFKLDKFKPDYNFYSWLRTICVNLVRDSYRRKKSYENSLSEFSAYINSTGEVEFSQNERVTILNNCLQKLSPDNYNLIKNRYISREKIKNIAKRMKIAEGALKMKLRRIRLSLKACMNKRGIESE